MSTDRLLTWREYQERTRIPVLDGVRAISILLVIFAHGRYQQIWHHVNGGNGVTIFFVLSGYLITTLLLRENDRRGKVSLAGFYVRRFFRIWPLYLLALAAYCVTVFIVGIDGDRSDALAHQLPYYLLFFPEHGRPHWFLFNGPPFSQAWSLGMEEKFYFLWPLLGFVVLRGRLLARLVVCAAVFVGCIYGLYHWADGAYLSGYAPIALGCAAALLLHHRGWYERLRILGATVPFALIAAATVLLLFSTNGGIVHQYALELGITLTLIGLVVPRRPVPGVLVSSPALLIGRLSYSLYLFQGFALKGSERLIDTQAGPAQAIAGMALALAIGIALTYALHVTVERPLIRFGHRLSERLGSPSRVLERPAVGVAGV